MAKGKNSAYGKESELEAAIRYFDAIWRQKYGCPLNAAIIEHSKTHHHVQHLALFATPPLCSFHGKKIIFKTESAGLNGLHARQATALFRDIFISTVIDLALTLENEKN